ncbi:hypothetical protein N7466_010913 [Penicillium verhagenii]|uniref:uncharacterized protein n=1 Tax=Penicillium verhagenii TaxID=1562060 RepID=UPI0025456D36|nr:uncharacterized protein N7466_010913 [Penicillium verhagenii]KAJ5917359.1 hypothetical protein N7466_010913 [Penicillium verhagenii]
MRLLLFFILALAVRATNWYRLEPEKLTDVQRVPSLQTLATSQLTHNHGSWWTGSLISAKNGHQYFVISHYVNSGGQRDLYRASVLDLDSLEYHSFVQVGNGSYPSSDFFHLVVGIGGNGFEGISGDNLAAMRTHSTQDDVTFDLIYHLSTLPLVTGGPDINILDDGKAYGWALPACKTYGTMTINDQKIHVDSRHSLTWYDRYWGSGGLYSNWTWFHLHMPGGFKLSIWAGDRADNGSDERLATIRTSKGSLTLVGVSCTPDSEHTWYSSATDKTYPLAWTVLIPDYISTLRIISITEDQLSVGPSASGAAYGGFVTFSGEFLGAQVEGYGMVEIAGQ